MKRKYDAEFKFLSVSLAVNKHKNNKTAKADKAMPTISLYLG
jgi:hypothetical protein